jgi:hypothetical protein
MKLDVYSHETLIRIIDNLETKREQATLRHNATEDDFERAVVSGIRFAYSDSLQEIKKELMRDGSTRTE